MVESNKMKLSFTNLDRIYVVFVLFYYYYYYYYYYVDDEIRGMKILHIFHVFTAQTSSGVQVNLDVTQIFTDNVLTILLSYGMLLCKRY